MEQHQGEQSLFDKIRRWSLFIKHNLRFWLIWASWALYSSWISRTFYNYFKQHLVYLDWLKKQKWCCKWIVIYFIILLVYDSPNVHVVHCTNRNIYYIVYHRTYIHWFWLRVCLFVCLHAWVVRRAGALSFRVVCM